MRLATPPARGHQVDQLETGLCWCSAEGPGGTCYDLQRCVDCPLKPHSVGLHAAPEPGGHTVGQQALDGPVGEDQQQLPVQVVFPEASREVWTLLGLLFLLWYFVTTGGDSAHSPVECRCSACRYRGEMGTKFWSSESKCRTGVWLWSGCRCVAAAWEFWVSAWKLWLDVAAVKKNAEI